MKTRVILTLAVLLSPGLLAMTGAATLETWGGDALEQKPEWYFSDEAREVADKVLQYQSSVGAGLPALAGKYRSSQITI